MVIQRAMLLAALALLGVAASESLAQRGGRDASPQREPSASGRHPSVDTIGLEFREQLINDAIVLVESDKGDEAVSSLKTALADLTIKDDDRRREIKAGLGLVYTRIGDFGNANQNAHALVDRDNGSTLGPRCRAIELAVAEASKKGPEYRTQLKNREVWIELLRSVRRACETRFAKEHADLSKNISDQHWTAIVAPAKGAYREASVIDVIWVKDEGGGSNLLAEHAKQMAAELRAINAAAAEHHRAGLHLAGEIQRMRVRKNSARFSLIDTYDNHRNQIISARSAANALIAEFNTEKGKAAGMRGQAVPAFTTPDLVKIEKE